MAPNDSMAGKIVFCTGARRGIGLAAAKAFADRGATVYAADIIDETDPASLSPRIIQAKLDVLLPQKYGPNIKMELDMLRHKLRVLLAYAEENRKPSISFHLVAGSGRGDPPRAASRRLSSSLALFAQPLSSV